MWKRILLLSLLGACASAPRPTNDTGDDAGASRPAITVDGEFVLIDAADGRSLTLEEAVDRLEPYDVVFLGEQHDNDVGHEVQIALTELLLARHGDLIVSMEQFERDAQEPLDRYLAGEIDEDEFLSQARPWPNYAEHYRPAIELAKEHGLAVVAGNVPRRLASRVVREGSRKVLPAAYTPRALETPPGEYKDRFRDAMGGHGDGVDQARLDNVYAAQCLKDSAMAEGIADALDAQPGTPVVHWCGRFHSDAHLGTVERLAWRRPDLKIAVVTMNSAGALDRPLSDRERADGDLVLRVPVQPDDEE